MKIFPKKYVLPILAVLLGSALAAANWEKLCYAKGRFDAKRNIAKGNRITYGYGLSEAKNDTTWIVDSLLYREMGYQWRGTGCVISYTFAAYIDGYKSTYDPFLKETVLPEIEEKAKSILRSRPVDWKDGLSEDEKKMRALVF